jgi:hypothetical protein
MEFRKYQHVEKLGTMETDGLLDGVCHVFYKIDGTNASVWLGPGGLHCGSRNRELSLENDNQGFCKHVHDNLAPFTKFFMTNPTVTLYGEWLVPHSLKTYRETAWREFYVFDVVDESGGHMPYEEYVEHLANCGINYVPPLATIKNPTHEQLTRFLEKSGEFLVKDGEGKGEGIVIKNYDYQNRFGRQTWGKIVTNEFKEKHHKEMGAPEVNNTLSVEEKIVNEFLSEAFIEKEIEKIKAENEGFWHNRFLPRLFGVVQFEFVKDHIHLILKKFKQPKIDFKQLNVWIIRKCKEVVNP